MVCVPAPGPNEGAAVIDVGRGPGRASKIKVAELRDGKMRKRRAGDDAPEIAMKHVCRVKHLERPQSLQMVNMDQTEQAGYIPGI